MTQHLTIGAELVNASKNQANKLVANARMRWYNMWNYESDVLNYYILCIRIIKILLHRMF